jgi:hypothetical protein
MTAATIVGVLALALPTLIVYRILFRKTPVIFWFAVALTAIGIGYLVTTGAAEDIGRMIAPPLAAKKA